MGDFRREVLPSRQGRSLLAPLLVLSSTLTVTLGMAILSAVPHPARPRPAHAPPHLELRQAPPTTIARPQGPATPAVAPPVDCGAPVLRQRADGMTDATFEVCAGRVQPTIVHQLR